VEDFNLHDPLWSGPMPLSREDWLELEHIEEFLQSFVDWTLKTESLTASLDRTFEGMELIIRHFDDMKFNHSSNLHMRTRITVGWLKFQKYYKLTDETAVYAASILLHPQRRRVYLEKCWVHQQPRTLTAVNAVRTMWQKYFKPKDFVAPVANLESIGDPIARRRFELTNTDLDIEEFEEFIDAAPTRLMPLHTPLEWWLDPVRQAAYPNLSRMAITVFTIPPMSAGPERVFSGAKLTISTECLKSWVGITPGKQQAPLSGVFADNQFVNEAIQILEKGGA